MRSVAYTFFRGMKSSKWKHPVSVRSIEHVRPTLELRGGEGGGVGVVQGLEEGEAGRDGRGGSGGSRLGRRLVLVLLLLLLVVVVVVPRGRGTTAHVADCKAHAHMQTYTCTRGYTG